MYVNRNGIINEETVNCILNNYINYIQKDPGSIIAGYDEAKKKFKNLTKLKAKANSLNSEQVKTTKLLALSNNEDLEEAKKLAKFL